jgi:serine/threonine protein kinase
MYRKTGGGKLPLKWLAIESMTHQVYTSQSDVWSFGILLFEIVSLGAAPYPSISADQLVKKLSNGYRLEKPFHCHSSLYDVMHSCWHINPQARPSFDELSAKLQNFLIKEKSSDINFIELAKLFAKCSDET